MSDNTYNGWSNYETWCVSLWLDNDEGNYNAVRELVDLPDDLTKGEQEDASYELAQAIKEYVEELPEVLAVTEGPASFVTDLLGAALSEVDWQEIAENLISEVKE